MMSKSLTDLPQFFRLNDEDIANLPISPGSFIVSTDKHVVYVDLDDSRQSLAPVQTVRSIDDLANKSPNYIYVSANGSLYVNIGGTWNEYTPSNLSEASYLYRFEVTERVSEIRFSAESLGVTHAPEFDILDADNKNISGSDWITRGWDKVTNEYVLSCAGGWPVGVYYLKLSYNVRYDSAGAYIQDDSATQAVINMCAGEHYVFTQPLTSLTISSFTGRGEGSVTFKSTSSTSFNVPDNTRFLDSVPTINPNTDYYVVIRNGVLSIHTIVDR